MQWRYYSLALSQQWSEAKSHAIWNGVWSQKSNQVTPVYRYTGDDFMFSYRVLMLLLPRLNSRPQLWSSSLTLAMSLTLIFCEGQIYNLLYLSRKWSSYHETKANISFELKVPNMSIRFDLGHDLDLQISRPNLWPHTWTWPWIFKVKFWLAISQEWEGRLIYSKRDVSQSFMTMTMTFWWLRWGVRIHWIVTSVTSDVGVRQLV